MNHQSQTNNYTEFFYYAFRNVLLVSIPLLLISALILSLPHSSAYSSSTDSVALTLPSACTISASVVTPHNITLVNGQKQDDIGNTKINAYCNDNNGYFIYAIGSSNDIAGNTDLISSVNSSYNIHTGIYPTTLTASTPSSWAMKLSSNNGTYAPIITPSYTNYTTVPNTDTVVAYRTSGTSMDINTDLTGSYFNTTYQIYANSIQPAGTYLGKVKYTMTHPYDATQLPNIENAFDIAGVDKVTVPGVGNYYAMQDMSDRICSLVTANETEEQLVDIRDNKIYYVSKLIDGHCWMTQNLDLDLISDATTEGYVALTSENTDLNLYGSMGYDSNNGYSCSNPNTTTNCTASGEVITWTPERATIPEGSLNSTTWPNRTNDPDSYDSGLETPNGIMGGHGYTGNYYNWTAAIASNNSSSYSANNTVAANSICPKGWRLPNVASMTGGYEFSKLLYAYGVTNDNTNGQGYTAGGFDKIIASPLYFVRPGYLYDGSRDNYTTGGRYWSSAVLSASNVYGLGFDSNYVAPANNLNTGYGRSVRCIAE